MLPPKTILQRPPSQTLGQIFFGQPIPGQSGPFPVTPAPSPGVDIAAGAAGVVALAFLIDATVGGVAGYWLAPKGKKLGYVVGGAAATTVAGSLGLLGLIGYHHFSGD